MNYFENYLEKLLSIISIYIYLIWIFILCLTFHYDVLFVGNFCGISVGHLSRPICWSPKCFRFYINIERGRNRKHIDVSIWLLYFFMCICICNFCSSIVYAKTNALCVLAWNFIWNFCVCKKKLCGCSLEIMDQTLQKRNLRRIQYLHGKRENLAWVDKLMGPQSHIPVS